MPRGIARREKRHSSQISPPIGTSRPALIRPLRGATARSTQSRGGARRRSWSAAGQGDARYRFVLDLSDLG
jgi:hypothetical protein